MARPTLSTHPKFHRLAALLGSRATARGSLELIWECAYASGDPVIGDSLAVEASADWRGEAGRLTEALVSSGFLDPIQVDANGGHLHSFAVHDLEHHAPDYVLKRWEREAKRRAAGDSIRTIRQRAAKAKWDALSHASVRRCPPLSAVVLPPTPAPAPQDPNIVGRRGSIRVSSPPKVTSGTPSAANEGGAGVEYPKAFLEVWERTGRRGSKFKGWKAWKVAKSPPWSALAVSWGAYMRSPGPSRGFVQHLSTWLNARGWDQEWPAAGQRDVKPADPSPGLPAPLPIPGDKRCFTHMENPKWTAKKPAEWCPDCREQVARAGTRTMTEDETLQPPDWMGVAKGGET